MNDILTFSKYNVFSKIKDSKNYFILNLLSGNADILEPLKADEIIEKRFTDIDEYVDKGYLVNPAEEEKLFKLKFLEFLDQRDSDEIQIFFVPRYACNFSCSYCYQSEYETPPNPLTQDVVDAFFQYIDSHFAGKKKYLTIFGGEPLMNGSQSQKDLQWLLDGANQRNLDVAVVTNGFHLIDYIDILKESSIREIQVTLDGTQHIHDSRRPLRNGSPTFDRIVEGIDAALHHHLPINLRVVVDKENIENLKDLAAFAIQKGWTDNALFKTQLGRNYELHTCRLDSNQLFSRIGLYEKVYELVNAFPQFLEFHRPAYSVSRFLFENGELPEPLFDSCPGTKTEWAFDYTGKIYACTATVGKSGEALGTFYPNASLDDDTVELWQDRDVTSIPDCKECAVQLACGGGCASVAKNKTGSITSPDCRPIKELLEMGISLYFNREFQDETNNELNFNNNPE
jgi:uncharacterized protein